MNWRTVLTRSVSTLTKHDILQTETESIQNLFSDSAVWSYAVVNI